MSLPLITKADLTEVKSLAAPPQAVKDTFSAVICLLGYPKNKAEDWGFAKKLMGSTMLDELKNYKPKAMPAKKLDYIKGKIDGLSADSVKAKSCATVSFYNWAKSTMDSVPVGESEEKST